MTLLRKLKGVRLGYCNSITETYMSAVLARDDKSKHALFFARYQSLDKDYENFMEAHNEVIQNSDDDFDYDAEDAIRKGCSNNYNESKAIFFQIFQPDSLAPQKIMQPDTNSSAILDRLRIPKFSGDLREWPTFYDLYTSLIHDKRDMSDIEKFQRLLTYLEGDARNLVKSIPLVADNYGLAIQTLTDRYQNKRLLATNALNAIYNISPKNESAKELQSVLNTFAESVSYLRTLGFPVDQWSFVLFHLLMLKIPATLRTSFETKFSHVEIPTYTDLFDFLKDHCKALESVQFLAPVKLKIHAPSNISSKTHSNSFITHQIENQSSQISIQKNNNSNFKCFLCKEMHTLAKCPSFLAKTVQDRHTFVKKNKLCFNCLFPHTLQNCLSTYRCRVGSCGLMHHTLLHMESSNISHSSGSDSNACSSPQSSGKNRLCMNTTFDIMTNKDTVLLATAVIDIQDCRGNFQPIRAVIDSASEANFISEKMLQRLGISRSNLSISISGLNDMSSNISKGIARCSIKPRCSDSSIISFDAIVLPKVCSNLPSFDLQAKTWDHISNLQLADPNFHESSPVGLLLGADVFIQTLLGGKITGDPGQPTALETIFGYVLLGKVDTSNPKRDITISNSYRTSCVESNLDQCMEKFWQLENIPSKIHRTPEEIKCEKYFQETVSRDSTGRFIVALPFKDGNLNLGDSFSMAYRRFNLLEKRLLKNPTLHKDYSEFMQDYIDTGHMSLVSSESSIQKNCWYLPHHCVIKTDAVTTRLRVVFDGAAKGTNSVSLNSVLLTGPKLQKDISSLLLIFRFYPLVFISDIKQCFRNILLRPEDRDFQRILWRFDPSQPLLTYRLNTVTYGLTSSPYLCIRTLNKLADEERPRYPRAAEILDDQTFVDDCFGGSSSLDECLSLQGELIDLLRSGGFELRKWASNCPEVLANIPESNRQMSLSFDLDDPNYIKMLGLQWNPRSDTFSYKVVLDEKPVTKRTILSQIARLFDPQGFLSPVTLLAKHIMQRLWSCKDLDWDSTPDQSIINIWNQFKSELPELCSINLPRRVLPDIFSNCQLHGFCDASLVGYCAVIYFRCITPDGIFISFVTAKSRVSPLKTVSLPRLELCAAVLLADLIHSVRTTYEKFVHFDEVFAWSDSQVALSWIASSPHRWKVFVANRVSHIQEILPSMHFRHVRSEFNSADIGSRGVTPKRLLDCDLWWNSPPFLRLPESKWPNEFQSVNEEFTKRIFAEEKGLTVFNTVVMDNILDNLLNNISSLPKIQRLISYFLRLLPKSKRIARNSVYPSPEEMENALFILIRHVQYQAFQNIIDALKQNRLLQKPFRRLSLFLDSRGFVRVGGRLKFSELNYDAKHPYLLPKSHRFTTLVIEYTHNKFLHPGFKTMSFLLLQRYWILSARRAIEKTLSRCLRCFRLNPKSYIQPMSDLPFHRVSQFKCFLHTAIDFCGPFYTLGSRYRGSKVLKSYCCVFVCTSTKAIHLELTSDLSSEAFLASFRRFVARRGTVAHIYSDNATTFHGCDNILKEYSKQVSESLSITWHWSPSGGPHFNGLSEAGVKSVKTHLLRVIGEQRLTFEEFTTFLCQVEAILNSRPLFSPSKDPNDLLPITPGHFLNINPLNALPDQDLYLSDVKISTLSRWQLIQRLQSEFWARWHKEYLHTLQQRSKWTELASSIELNSLVLLKNETKSPLQWPLARVVALYPGVDGIVRVVDVKTATGTYRRPVVKLCPLPIQN